mmetsp:Transcript_45499/g.120626  ORF Transcript_45499/g.120626 Transcript_45499/m.120626 type:complete len:224 (+) Transcript_45499:1180-1851(+)
MSSEICERLSKKVPYTSREYMDVPMSGKYFFSTSVPSVICRKQMANTYSKKASKTRVTITAFNAWMIPFIWIRSSGTARNSRPSLAMRVSRRRRAILSSAELPSGFDWPLPVPAASRMIDMTHVSKTMVVTSMVSNTNQPSLKQLSFLLKAPNRTLHSKVKKRQNKFSATTNWYSASTRVSLVLLSLSYAIHRAFATMTMSVALSNLPFVAILRHQERDAIGQ